MSSNCIHVTSLGDYTKEDIIKKQQESKCDTCLTNGPYLWICLHYDCLYVGCGEHGDDHSTQHFKNDPEHCLTLNLTSLRLWCYLCESEVFLGNNCPPVSNIYRRIPTKNVSIASADPDTDDETLDEDHNLKPRGLTGLQNIGNSCYMNSAIQALSNCPPLTNFFLDCSSFVRSEKKPGLSKSYLKLMSEMWHKKRPSYLVPSSIAYGIKMVCPMFRGYTQQDSQEFLRCFMDQLHEELKEPRVDFPTSDSDATSPPSMEVDVQIEALESGEESSQSEAEYETCDSGLSSEKSSCSEDLKESQEGINGKVSRRTISGFNNRGGGGGGVGGNRESFLSRRASSPPHENGYHSLPRGDGGNYREQDFIAEYSDAMSDTLPVSQIHVRSSSPSASSLPDRPSTFTSEKQHQLRGISASVPQIKVQSLLPGLGCSNSAVSSNCKAAGGSKISGRRKKQTKYHSIISDVFDGKILSSVQCLTCDRVSSTKETFQDLSLPIPSREYLSVLHASQCNTQKGALSTCTDVYSNQGWFSWMFSWMKSLFWGPTVSLQDCLAAFFSADELKGDNMYSCEKCKKLRNGIKYSKVLELPEILCVHLKRFRHEVMFSAKLSSYVSFPLEGLDMQPLLHKDCQAAVTTYDLVAVICHHGTAGGRPPSGHYTAYALNCINDQWYEFDDQYVTEVDPQLVANSEAYVLFYRKTSEEMMKKRQRAVELMEMSKREPSLMQFYISKQWVNKFNTFAEPGPIDNTDFLCPHGGVHPNKFGYAEELCTILSQGVWEYLHHSFGGGPPCTHLYLCPTCQQEIDFLEGRRKLELDEFVRLHQEFRGKESAINIYVISMAWFRIWEAFVKGKDDEPPGPIDNNAIAFNKMGQFLLKSGSDYAQVSEEIWQFFRGIYGGGPVLTIPPSGSGSDSGVPSTVGSNTSFVASPPALPNGIASKTNAEICSNDGKKTNMDCEEVEEKLETVTESDDKPMDVVESDDESERDDEKTSFIISGSRTTSTGGDGETTHLAVVT